MLASRLGSFEDLRVADLFAGSGALGLEALSRGAAMRRSSRTIRRRRRAIRANAAKLGVEDRVRLIGGSALALPRSEPFDLVFADPPYAPGSGSARRQSDCRCGLARARRLAVGRDRSRASRSSRAIMRWKPSARSAALELRFCAGLSLSSIARLLGGAADLVELGRDPPADRRSGGLARRPSASSSKCRPHLARGPSALGDRRERGGRADRQEVDDQRALKQLDQRVDRIALAGARAGRLDDRDLPELLAFLGLATFFPPPLPAFAVAFFAIE